MRISRFIGTRGLSGTVGRGETAHATMDTKGVNDTGQYACPRGLIHVEEVALRTCEESRHLCVMHPWLMLELTRAQTFAKDQRLRLRQRLVGMLYNALKPK